MNIPIFTKLPGSTQLDYTFDWNVTDDFEELPWLEDGETIVSYSATSSDPDNLVVFLVMQANGKVTVWITGGELNKTYIITCQITTSNDPPRIEERMIAIKIVEQK